MCGERTSVFCQDPLQLMLPSLGVTVVFGPFSRVYGILVEGMMSVH